MSLQTTTDDAPEKGVIVTDVSRRTSLAAGYGVQKGDYVVEVNGARDPHYRTYELDDACAEPARYWDLVTISRRGGLQLIRTRIIAG